MTSVRLQFMEAIVCRRTVTARYNGELITLAPHLLFERHGDLFVSAVNLSKRRRPEDAQRLGQFKLAGLDTIDVLEESFDPLPHKDMGMARSDDVLILSV